MAVSAAAEPALPAEPWQAAHEVATSQAPQQHQQQAQYAATAGAPASIFASAAPLQHTTVGQDNAHEARLHLAVRVGKQQELLEKAQADALQARSEAAQYKAEADQARAEAAQLRAQLQGQGPGSEEAELEHAVREAANWEGKVKQLQLRVQERSAARERDSFRAMLSEAQKREAAHKVEQAARERQYEAQLEDARRAAQSAEAARLDEAARSEAQLKHAKVEADRVRMEIQEVVTKRDEWQETADRYLSVNNKLSQQRRQLEEENATLKARAVGAANPRGGAEAATASGLAGLPIGPQPTGVRQIIVTPRVWEIGLAPAPQGHEHEVPHDSPYYVQAQHALAARNGGAPASAPPPTQQHGAVPQQQPPHTVVQQQRQSAQAGAMSTAPPAPSNRGQKPKNAKKGRKAKGAGKANGGGGSAVTAH